MIVVLVLKCCFHPSIFFFLFERRMGRTKQFYFNLRRFDGNVSLFPKKGIYTFRNCMHSAIAGAAERF